MRKRIASIVLSACLCLTLLPFAASEAAAADTAANFTNLVIFCRFSDEDEEFIHTEYANTKVLDIIDNTYNNSKYSVADYFRTVSGGKMNMQTLYLLDTNGASLQLSQPRGYYAKQTDGNPIGFGSGGGSLRISELMRDWGTAVNAAIEYGAVPVDAAGNKHSFAELDKNGDGQIDLITVIYKNTEQTNISVAHADPLWDYHYTYTGVSATENGSTYTSSHYVQLTCNYTNSDGSMLYRDGDGRVILGTHGKICHETTHGLGLLDLYSGTSDASKVGYMSLMAKHTSPIGQFLSAKEREALGWLDGQAETMTGSGSYTLRPADSTTGTVAYKVDLSTGKTLYLEYRQFDQPSNRYDYYKKDLTYIQTGNPNSGTEYKSGLICYLATTDRSIPSSGDLEVVSAGQQDTKTDCAVGLNETLRDKIYSNNQWIDITVTAMDASSLTFSITGLPGSAEKTLSSLAISGSTSMTVPTQANGAATLNLTATASYSDNSSADVTSDAAWSLTNEYTGVSVSGGVVTVAPEAAAGSVTVQAEYQGKQAAHTITLAKDDTTAGTNVTIDANRNRCTYGYAEAEAPRLTAKVDGIAEGTAVTYEWYVDDVVQNGKTGDTFTFPTGKNAGSYTVKCKATVDGSAITSEGFFVTVKRATPTVTTSPTAAVTYGKTVDNGDIQGAMSVGGAFKWKDVSTYGDATNGTPKTLTATFTPTDTTNYASVDVEVTVTIARKAITPTVTVTESGIVYDGTAKTPAVTVKDGETTIPASEYEVAYSDNINAGTATVTVTDKTGGNYAIGEAGTTFDIGKAKLPAPTFGTISESGKKLSDVTVNKDGKADTFSWDKGNDTEVKRGESYAWTLTPKDAANYDTLTGSYTPWSAPSSGGGGGSSSSGTTITVPVSSDHTSVEVKATVSKGNATVEVSDKQIEKVAADGAGDVTLDVSGLKNVESATVPSHVVEKTNEAENTGLTVALPAGSVKLDETALESVTENAKGKDVTVSVVAVPTANLSTVVKDIIGMEPTVLAVVDVNVTISGKKQSSFDGGKVTISVPYTPKAGEDPSKLTVWFIKDDGTIENKGGWYDAENKCFVFETDHLSQYILVNTNEAVSFTDVPANAWYAASVNWAVGKNITSGIGNEQFGPDLSCTRAQLVTFLYRAAVATGVDVSVGADTNILSYSDALEIPEYAFAAFQWAVGAGIVEGADGALMPNDDCTRAQIVTMLFRYAAANSMDAVTLQELVGGYGDAAQVPSYALPAFNWALALGIVNGNNGNLMPNNDCTRAQIVTMLYRLLGE